MSSQIDSLHRACADGTLEDIRNLLKNGEINAYNQEGHTPLHVAIKIMRCDIEEVVTLLVDEGEADVDATWRQGDTTALLMVVQTYETPDVENVAFLLLGLGADPDIRDGTLRSAFDHALERGRLDLASVLSGASPLDGAKQKWKTEKSRIYGERLVEAVMKGEMEEIDLCISYKADINHINKHGAGALHYLVTHCQLNKEVVLRKLILSGADVNLTDHEGDTALNLVIKTPSLRHTPMMRRLAEMLLQAGCKPSLRDLDGNNATTLATEKGYSDIVELIGRGPNKPKSEVEPEQISPSPPSPSANQRSTTPQPPSPLPDLPTTTPSTTETEIQTDSKEEEEEEEDDQQNPQVQLFNAIENGSLEDVEDKLQHPNINLSIPNKDGLYCLHLTMHREKSSDKYDILTKLLSEGANKDAQDVKEWRTPLHIGCERNDLEAVQVVLKVNPNYRLTNISGEKPYDVAMRLGHEDIAKILDDHRVKDLKGKLQKGAKKAKTCLIS